VNYAGMGSVEYKWNRSSSRFLIIEPTVGRTDLQEEIATLCGVNIPMMAYRHELHQPCPSPSVVRRDIVWRSSILEPLKGVAADLPSQVKVRDGYFRCEDPMPALVKYTWGLCAGGAKKLVRSRKRAKGGATPTGIPPTARTKCSPSDKRSASPKWSQ